MNHKIELLAPAGDMEAFRAAAENGADAIYMGGRLFNARHYAENFEDSQLRDALDYAHLRGIKVYLTLNTLIADSEMNEALELAGEAYTYGIDGIIIQDLGLVHLLRTYLPGLPLHASTQMTIYSPDGLKMLEELGFERVVLARELSLEEIERITGSTRLEVEVFGHGALCVCYSGQCLMSSIIGGRSGNRGRCAQPCRLPYQLVGSGENKNSFTSPKGHLLSPKDICTIDFLDKLAGTGISSLKIEGRMKSPEYVAIVVGIYRKYLDRLAEASDEYRVDEEDVRKLTQIFNRGGFSSGYFKGKTGKDMMSFEKPKNWGIYLGETLGYDRSTRMVKIKLGEDLSVGDGMEVWTGEDEHPGTVVSEILLDGRITEHAKAGNVIMAGFLNGRISAGMKVYKTSDKELNESARQSYTWSGSRKTDISCSIEIQLGQPASMKVTNKEGLTVTAVGQKLVEAALNKALTAERVKEQIGKTGSTPFSFDKIEVRLDEGVAIAVSELNNLRRSCLEQMEQKMAESFRRVLPSDFEKIMRTPDFIKTLDEYHDVPHNELHHAPEDGFHNTSRDVPHNEHNGADSRKVRLSVQLYNVDADVDYSSLGVDRFYIPFSAFLKDRQGKLIERFRNGDTELFVWMPSITRGHYEKLLDTELPGLLQKGANGVLAGNLGTIRQVKNTSDTRMAGDFTLNPFNSSTLQKLAAMGLDSVALSPELNMGQITQLADMPGLTKEAVAYGRLPLMTSEYCPVGSVKGEFTADKRCKGVCSKGQYWLKDRKSMEFPVMTDPLDCRSTILNTNVLFVPDLAGKLVHAGIGMLRLIFSDEKPWEIAAAIQLFREILDHGGSYRECSSEFTDSLKKKGFTRGHYLRGV